MGHIILSNLSEAYGRMILGEGLFQADGHPGNVLVRRKGSIALLDYGQSKQLPAVERDALARLVVAMDRCGWGRAGEGASKQHGKCCARLAGTLPAFCYPCFWSAAGYWAGC